MFPRNIVIIGRHGQLARELADLAWPSDLRPRFLGRDEINLFETASLARSLAALQPVVIVNAAAYTAVDLAESEPVLATALNADMPARLAGIATRLDTPLIHISTDYVFAGDATTPYREDDATGPASVYGQSKLAGEEAVLAQNAHAVVVRSAGLFGRHGQNFLKSMLMRSLDLKPISMVADQIHTPTPAAALAEILQSMALDMAAGKALPPRLHVAGQSAVTWLDFTRHILTNLRAGGIDALPALQPIPLSALSRPAPRPRFSALDCSLAASLGYAAPDWKGALRTLVPALIKERIAA